MRRIKFIQARTHYSSLRHGLRTFYISTGQYNQFQRFDRSRNGLLRTHFISRPNRSRVVGNWKQTYTEDEVGFGFLQDYGYLELYGPNGHFQTDQGRAYVGYWGRGLYYPWHRHEAEEIYAVVSGSGYFESQGAEAALLKMGDTRMHNSNQPHALTMTDGPILTFVLWRGAGMAGLPLMGAT